MVREVLQDFKRDARVTGAALGAMQESAEIFLVQVFSDSELIARHAKRVTVQPKDFMLWSLIGENRLIIPSVRNFVPQ